MKKILMVLMLCLVSICVFTSCEKSFKVKNYTVVTESDIKNEILELQNELLAKPDYLVSETDAIAIKILKDLKIKDCISYLEEVLVNNMETDEIKYAGKYPNINFLDNTYCFMWGFEEDIVAYQMLDSSEDWIFDFNYLQAERTFKRRNDYKALKELYGKYGKISPNNPAIIEKD